MQSVHLSLLVLFLPSLLCALSVVMVVLIKRENKLLSQQLTETTVSLEATRKQFAELRDNHAEIKEFQNSLQVAELTTRLQKTRLDARNIETNSATPEKYRYVRSLAERGMPAEEIASVLTISAHEARQLVSLSKLGQGNFPENVAD